MKLLTGILSDVLEGQRAEIIKAHEAKAVESRSSLENPQTPLSYPAEWCPTPYA